MLSLIHKFQIPVSIVLGCLIVGSFYYVSEVKKQESIERQVQMKIEAEKENEERKAREIANKISIEKIQRESCSTQAQLEAVENYKFLCDKYPGLYSGCEEGTYNKNTFKENYEQCINELGL